MARFRDGVPVDNARIDNLAQQLGAVLVELARLGATVEGMRGEQTRSAVEVARDLADHEVRLRELEGHGTKEHGEQIRANRREIDALVQWRARVIGWLAGASAAGGLTGAGLAVAVERFLQ